MATRTVKKLKRQRAAGEITEQEGQRLRQLESHRTKVNMLTTRMLKERGGRIMVTATAKKLDATAKELRTTLRELWLEAGSRLILANTLVKKVEKLLDGP